MDLTRGRRASACGGLTFVELLIASTMMAILFVGLAAHLRGGLTVWKRATETAGQLQERRVALDRLSRDLGNGLVIAKEAEAFGEPPLLPPVEFAANALQWYTWRQPRGDDPGGVQLVRYACEQVDGAWGLWRTARSLGQARMADLQTPPELLLSGCRELAVQYAYRPAGEDAAGAPLFWSPTWSHVRELPQLVEVSLSIDPDTEGQAPILLRQAVRMPAGVLKPFDEEPA